MTVQQQSLHLTPRDNRRLATLCGQCDENLRVIERYFQIEIHNRGHIFTMSGPATQIQKARACLEQLYDETLNHDFLSSKQIQLVLKTEAEQSDENTYIQTKRGTIKPRSQNQKRYVNNIFTHDLNFGVGPAGTGKTFLAVACAVAALEKEQVQRIVLVRPVVEAGEHLGFLPGDLTQKVDPYFRPLYDALYEMLGFERVAKLIDRHVIEIAPLAYMRGRTLNESFIILDEGQNTTREQMKMFLTRIGFGSTAVITGDITQIDLPRDKHSGLRHALEVLEGLNDISFSFFQAQDVVRHALVQTIVQAYVRYEGEGHDT
jgi:phosphate starvation-inducible protein PhoH and related proteins